MTYNKHDFFKSNFNISLVIIMIYQSIIIFPQVAEMGFHYSIKYSQAIIITK